jgi:prevent-host-death family protein
MATTTVKSGEARTKWRELLDQVLSGKGDIVIERNGKRVAAIIPAEDYAEIREKLDAVRAVREAAATYNLLNKSRMLINTENGTATIPLDLYTKLVAERESRFAVIRKIQENAPDLTEEEIEEIVAETIKKVRSQHDSSSS